METYHDRMALRMTPKPHAFDEVRVWLALWHSGGGKKSESEILNFIQTTCESRVKAEVKKFAEEISISVYGTGSYDLRRKINSELLETISTALKKRGIE